MKIAVPLFAPIVALVSGCSLLQPEGAVDTNARVVPEAVAGSWSGDVLVEGPYSEVRSYQRTAWESQLITEVLDDGATVQRRVLVPVTNFYAPNPSFARSGTVTLDLPPDGDATFAADFPFLGDLERSYNGAPGTFETVIEPRYQVSASGPWILAGNHIVIDRGTTGDFALLRVKAVTADALGLEFYQNVVGPVGIPFRFQVKLERSGDSTTPSPSGPLQMPRTSRESMPRTPAYAGIWVLDRATLQPPTDRPVPPDYRYPDQLALDPDGRAEFGSNRGTWSNEGNFIFLEIGQDENPYAFRVVSLSEDLMVTRDQGGYVAQFRRESDD